MALYKFQVNESATPRELETAVSHGPFIVEADSVDDALTLLSLNFDIAIERRPNEEPPTWLWDARGSHIVTELKHADPAKLQQHVSVKGRDVAMLYLDEPALMIGQELKARMVWWPCSATDICPA